MDSAPIRTSSIESNAIEYVYSIKRSKLNMHDAQNYHRDRDIIQASRRFRDSRLITPPLHFVLLYECQTLPTQFEPDQNQQSGVSRTLTRRYSNAAHFATWVTLITLDWICTSFRAQEEPEVCGAEDDVYVGECVCVCVVLRCVHLLFVFDVIGLRIHSAREWPHR